MLDVKIRSIKILERGKSSTILNNINFKIEHGYIYTLLGKNGSGKSTLIKSLTNLLYEEFYSVDGSVIFKNVNLLHTEKKQISEIRKKDIRYVFQDSINSFDPLRKIEYYFKQSSAPVDETENLLKYFLLPNYKKLKQLYPYELSGGMAQRLSIVLALLAKPTLLILDEPNSGIDYPVSNLLILKLKEFVNEKNRSVIIVTQDIAFAKSISDFIAVINNKIISSFKTSIDFFKTSNEESYHSLIESYKQFL